METATGNPSKNSRKPRNKPKEALPKIRPAISSADQDGPKPAQKKPDATVSAKNTIVTRSRKQNKNPASKTAWMLKNAGAIITTITADSITPSPTPVTSDTPSTLLCTYNWLLSGHAILVPGGPPKWTPPALPTILPADSGRQFIDQNASRVPKHPFEPAFAALLAVNPNARLDDVDIVVNRNSLRKLLDFAGGKRQEPFRMGLCRVGRTLFIARNEKNASMMIHGRAGPGYGHSFEKVFTTSQEGLDGSSSHHRVVRYMLGDLDCAVRFEVDAWLEDPGGDAEPADLIEIVAKKMANLSTADVPMDPPLPAKSTAKATARVSRNATTVLHAGASVPSSRLAELKTMSHKTKKSPSSSTPQLWFGRTPFLITGHHNGGTVLSTTIADVSARFPAWETANQDRLRKLVGLLRELIRVTEHEGEAILVCETKGGGLKVLQRKDGCGALPMELVERFWGGRETNRV